MSNTNTDALLLSSIITYLSQLKQTNPSVLSDPDSLDVAVQCLTEAISKQNTENNANNSSYSLKQIYEAGIAALSSSSSTSTPASTKEASASDKAAAEKLKNEGNAYLTQQRYDEAADKYTAAIKHNPNNAIYYANSRVSISLDPNYAKGHYRLGQSLYYMNRFQDCIPHYERALTLTRADPGMNETIQQQLILARERLQEGGDEDDEAGGAGGGMDFNAILNNPMFANLASQLGGGGAGGAGAGGAGGAGGLDFNALLSNPAIQQMAASMFGGGGGAGAGAGGGARQTPAAAKPATSPALSATSSTSSSSSSSSTTQPSSSASSSSSSSPSNPLAAFLASPAGQQLASDPELQPVIADVQANGPNALTKYLGNPAIMNKLSSIMGPLMSSMKKK